MDTCFKCGCPSLDDAEDSCAWCGEVLDVCDSCREGMSEKALTKLRERWHSNHRCISVRTTLERMKKNLDGLHRARVALEYRHEMPGAAEKLSEALRQLEAVFSELKPLGGLS